MQKKKRNILIISSVLLTVFVLSMLAVIGYFRYLPYFRLDKLQNEYLLQYRSFLRAGSVQAGTFNKFVLHDIQLGSSLKPLFAAPRAELVMHSNFRGQFSKIPVKSLILYDCRVKVESSGGKVYINGILLEEFVKEFDKLPAAADGKPLCLEIHSKLSFGGKSPSADLLLTIRQQGGNLVVSGRWTSLDNAKLTGCWQTFIDLVNNNYSVALSGNISGIFMQEILLRSGVPAKATALLNKGSISGKGDFSGSFSDLQVKELDYSGKVENPVVAFYEHKMTNIDSFAVKIKKNDKGISCEIPELSLKNQQAVILKNISMHGRKKIIFSADCDFQQLAAGCLLYGHSVDIKSEAPAIGRIKGDWSTVSDIWHVARMNEADNFNMMQFQAAGYPLIFKLEKFDFHAQGKGAAGTLNQQLKFKELEIYSAENKKKVHSSGGYFTLKTVFGAADRPDMNTLSAACNKFSMETPFGIVEIPGFSTSIELKQSDKQKIDIFTSISSTGGKVSFGQNLLEAAPWYGRFRLDADLKTQQYQVKNMDLKFDKIVLSRSQQEMVMTDAHVCVALAGKSITLQSANLRADAARVTAGELDMKDVDLTLDIDRKRSKNEIFKGKISCRKGVFPLTKNWFISKAVNANMAFANSDLKSMPQKTELNAHLLDWQIGDFSGSIQNSKWQLQREPDQSLNCTGEFDFAKVNSNKQKFGSSQLGKSTLAVNLALTADGTPVWFELSGILAQTSWLKDDYHVGSESVQCELKYNHHKSALMQGNITLSKANILGPQITASTPELQCKFTASDRNNITGNVKFAPGSITDPAGNIELRKAAFSLPLQISTRMIKHGSSGKFTAEDVFFKQQREGSFSGTVRHFMQLPAGVTDTLSHQIEISGEFFADKFNKKAVRLNSLWQLPPEKNVVKWQFSMPESKLVQMVTLSDYLDLPLNCTALKGNFTLDGSVDVSADRPVEGVIKLNSINADWQFGQITAEGVTAAGVFNLSNRKISLMPHDATLTKLLWNKWVLTDNELNLSLNSEGKLQIANWHGSLLGGKYRATQTPAVDISKPDESIPMKFTLEDIPLTGFFNQFGINQIKSDALLAGDIQLDAGKNGIQVNNSQLAFTAPAGKILQLKLDNPTAIKMRDRQFRDFTLAVLNSMKCYQANFSLTTAPGEVFMLLKADGVPAEPVPFVYQGRGKSTPFRPAKPGEEGFAGEIELNVNLKLHPGNPDA